MSLDVKFKLGLDVYSLVYLIFIGASQPPNNSVLTCIFF